MMRSLTGVLALAVCGVCVAGARADVTQFFNSTQVATSVSTGVTSDTISCAGYQFTYTRDKLFTGGLGTPIGRTVRVPWPTGVEAQAVTTPPAGVTDYKARLTVRRVDGGVFDLTAFTAKLLANTAATGGAIEIMPMLNGEDGFNDPLYFDVSGYYGQSFSYNESPNVWGSTNLLKGFDTYKIVLWVDFALTALTLQSPNVAVCPADYDADGLVAIADIFAFLNAWFAGSPDTDFDGINGLQVADIFAFLNAWFAGCP